MKKEPADWERIRERIQQRVVEDGGCWVWGSPPIESAPSLRYLDVAGKPARASVRSLAAILSGKKVPDGKCCIASCGNDKCVNPEHTKIITQADQKLLACKRSSTGVVNTLRVAKIASTMRAQSKLSDDDVRLILGSSISQDRLAEMLGISQQYVSSIKSGRARKSYAATPFTGLIC